MVMEPIQRSVVEQQKELSRQLRGTVAEELAGPDDHFSEANKSLLKFHGTYQQDDRDARKNRSKEGVGKHFMFMVRCRIPGGRLTASQYLAIDDLAGQFANGTLRFTSRQGIQLHGVLKGDLKATIAGINATLLTTLGACGDIERNVMVSPAPHYHSGVHQELQETAAAIASHLSPRTRAYHEIWLNGSAVAGCQLSVDSEENSSSAAPGRNGSGSPPPANSPLTTDNCQLTTAKNGQQTTASEEPLYGKVYLPRKFKTGIALPEDNCIDVYAQDLGLLAIVDNGTIVGYNVLVGGGMGMTHGNSNTFPHLAKPICYVPAASVVAVAEAVVRLFRDHGNRADRKRARIKYLIVDWGVEKFRKVLSEYFAGPLLDPLPTAVKGFQTHHGWHQQAGNRWWFGLSISNGRVKDDGSMRLRTGLREILKRFEPELRITPLQDVLLCGLDAKAKPVLEQMLADHGILPPERLSNALKYSMACPAIPTCGLAITESERALPGVIGQLEAELKRLGLEDEKLSVRMTGCPNGCVRPYQSDIGLVGRSGDKFTVFVGGNVLGTRLNFVLRDLVPLHEIVPLLVPLLEDYQINRQSGEGFGDYCQRLGVERLQMLLPSATGQQIVAEPAGKH
jgi:sulfite reductase (ferredoxin)